MKAVVLNGFGASNVLKLMRCKLPPMPSKLCKKDMLESQPHAIQNSPESLVLIRCVASAINRGDLLQKRGMYPPPLSENQLTQETNICGLEASGFIADMGSKVKRFRIGDPVAALLTGGGYGEYVLVDEACVMNLRNHIGKPKKRVKSIATLSFPEQWNMPQHSAADYQKLIFAACMPEAYLTAFQCLFVEHPSGGIKQGDNVLIHSGASGVGMAAIRICRAYGAVPHVTTRSPAKAKACRKIGALKVYNFSLVNSLQGDASYDRFPEKKSMDLIIDTVFGSNFFKNGVDLLKKDGVYIVLSFLGGSKLLSGSSISKDGTTKQSTEINFAPLLIKRNKIIFSTLRNRDTRYKKNLIRRFESFVENHGCGMSLDPIWTKELLDNVSNAENSSFESRISKIINIAKLNPSWIRPMIYTASPFENESQEEDVRKSSNEKIESPITNAENVQRAQELLETNQSLGKVVLFW